MSRQQGDESRRFSAVRGASEWVVRGYKGFDIFCGRPIQWQEWPNIDLYLQFVTMVLQMKGPFSDLTPAPAGDHTSPLYPIAICSLRLGGPDTSPPTSVVPVFILFLFRVSVLGHASFEVPLAGVTAVVSQDRCPLGLCLSHRLRVDRVVLVVLIELGPANQLRFPRWGEPFAVDAALFDKFSNLARRALPDEPTNRRARK